MIKQFAEVVSAYPTAPYELVSGWSMAMWAFAFCYPTPDAAILTQHTVIHSHAGWAILCASVGCARVAAVAGGGFSARRYLSAASGALWAAMWAAMFRQQGLVAALCLIPPLVVSDALSYLQTRAVALAMEQFGRRTSPAEGGRNNEAR